MALRLVRAENSAKFPNNPPRKQRQPGRKHVTPEEFDAIRRAARDSRNPTRDALLITMMYRHGLRISEAVGLTWDDVQLGRAGTLYIDRRKGSQSGTHTLDADELRMLRELHSTLPCRFVFVSERGTPLAIRSASQIITGAARAAGVPVTNPHALRHGTGYRLIRKGTDLRRVQDFLGHKDIKSTTRYTALDPDAIAGLERD